MPPRPRPTGAPSRVAAALDAARFGDAGRLDLHPLRPTARQAADRVRAWCLERQVQGLDEVLIVTGRGRHSDEGVSPVRTAVQQALHRLVRDGVATRVREHTAGAFVVTLAPVGARLDAAPRRRDPAPPPPTPVRRLEGLSDALVEALEALAEARLERLGIARPSAAQIVDEMQHVFSRLVGTRTPSEAALLEAIRRAHDALDD